MALNVLVLLSILQLAVTIPDPNVEVDVDVRVDNEGNGCCGGSKKSCNFGGITYPNKYMLTISCMEFQCMDGCWDYTDKFDHNCGNCTFGGEPIIYPFDTLNHTKPFSYDGNGTYVMTQPYFGIPGPGPDPGHANFGVMGHFTTVNPDRWGTSCDYYTDCIDGTTYYEPGITVRMTLAGTDGEPDFPKVYVNGKNVTIGNTPCKVHTFYGTDGAILVFKHASISGSGHNCISVIGTKGLTVALCKSSRTGIWGDPWAYIYASPELKTPTSQLYGLCNDYCGENAECFTDQNGTCVDTWSCGTSWDAYDNKMIPILCGNLGESWKVPTN